MDEKQLDNPQIAVERAIDELRRQSGLRVKGKAPFAFIPLESLDENKVQFINGLKGSTRSVLLTGARAKSLGLNPDPSVPVLINAADLNFSQMKFLADPTVTPTPIPPKAVPAPEQYRLALELAKFASLIPAVLIIEGIDMKEWPAIDADTAAPSPQVVETARAKLPIEGAEEASIISYRTKHGAGVHLALIIGRIASNQPPLVRVHSSCITGDILGSLRCDCGDQLKLALAEITKAGSGILVYLHQEGRGIGITNKIRAYALQEMGFDTYEANLMLGFNEDERDFAIAAEILKACGIDSVRLLTNNPQKISSLEKHGIAIKERVPLIAGSGRHNHAYLDAKAKKSGHLF